MIESKAAALGRLLAPRSVVIVGASANTDRVGGRLVTVLKQHGLQGQLYLVNPARSEIQGIPCYAAVADLPDGIDLAVVAVKAAEAARVVRECRARGIPAAYVVSSGFSEAQHDLDGQSANDELRDLVAEGGILVAGPNAEGIYNLVDDIAIGFSPTIDYDYALSERPPSGNVAVVAQSGGLGFGILNQGLDRGIGFSYVISTGNEVAVDALDYLEFLISDAATKVIVLFLEGVASVARFESLALRAFEAKKAIVVAKVGRTEEARLAAISHTGHLTGPSTLFSALFARWGVVEAETLEDLLDVASVLSRYDLSSGNGMGIVTGSGGAGAWLTDLGASMGLKLPAVPPDLQAQILAELPYYASARNPVDMTAGGGTNETFVRIIQLLASSREVDTVVLVQSLLLEQRSIARAQALGAALGGIGKPVLMYSYTLPSRATSRAFGEQGVPWFPTQRGAVLAATTLAARARTHARLSQPGEIARILATRERLRGQQIGWEPQHAGTSVPEYRVKALLAEHGIPVPAGSLAADARSAARIAAEIGSTVALKVQSPEIPHKAAVGAIRLNVPCEPEAVTAVCEELMRRAREQAPGVPIDGILVEKMADNGLELLIGAVVDPQLGPFLTVGAGGGDAEYLQDIATLPAECTAAEVEAALRGLRCWQKLTDSAGAARYDVPAFCEVAAQVSAIVSRLGDVLSELDLNPVLVHAPGRGVSVVDALATLNGHSTGNT